MKFSKVICTIILFSCVSFVVCEHGFDEEIKSAVVENDKTLNLTCNTDEIINIGFPQYSTKGGFWKDTFNASCPNRNPWTTFLISAGILLKCSKQQNCSIDFSNVTMANCTNFTNYIHVRYVCNNTETTTQVTTTTESNDDDDSGSSEERSSTTKKPTTTKKPPGGLEPNYAFHVVPGLITTPKPTMRPYHLPQPRLPVPAPQAPVIPPLFQNPFKNPFPYNYQPAPLFGGAAFGGAIAYRPPIVIPIPVFG